MKKIILNILEESIAAKRHCIENHLDDIIRAAEMLAACLTRGNKVLIFGNGGSAADAQHLAAEMVIRLSHDVVRPGLPAISLATDSSIMTAGGNDIGFDNVFARQVEALGHPEDVLLAISTSGNSPNIVKALEMAKQKGVKSIGFLGGTGGKCKDLADISIVIPSSSTQRIQEGHITVGHIIIELIERELF